LAPTSSSSERIWDEIAGWVRKRFSAAREKLDNLATSMKVSSWSKSIESTQHSAVSNQQAKNVGGRIVVLPKLPCG
jgi:hypothetical protein